MAGFGSLDVTNIQRITTLTGAGNMEFGCYSATSATTHSIPTTFTTLISGIACNSAGFGYAVLISDAAVDFSFNAATERTSYIVFGW